MADDKSRDDTLPTGGPGGASPSPHGPISTPAGPAMAPAGLDREAADEVDAEVARDESRPAYAPDPTGMAARSDLGHAAADPTPGPHREANSGGANTGLIFGGLAFALVVIVALIVLI
ncbi:hypothetical protein ACXN5S_15635 [Pseudoroseicyclus sp. H15]